MYDLHIHSEFSIDANYTMEDMVLSAIDKNMKTICFTDHIDLDATLQGLDLKFDVKDYFREFLRVKYRYMDEIQILSGVELGLQPHLLEENKRIINKYDFDFVILSIHNVLGMDIVRDEIFKVYTQEKVLKEYYTNLLYIVSHYNNYDVLGHLDFVDRYVYPQSDTPLNMDYYNELYDIIKEILTIAIRNDKGLELNTSGLRKGLDYMNPKIPILQLYKELGGEIITLASDAHTPENIGYEFKLAESILKELGYEHIYIYKDRKKTPIKI